MIERRAADGQRPIGRLTGSVAVATLAVSVVGLTLPVVLSALQRRPGEIADGQLWRLVSSLLVHDGWIALVSNLIALVVIGTTAERYLRPRDWIILYLVGGIGGQVVGLAWQPVGAGNSVAIFGLLGGLIVLSAAAQPDALFALAVGVVVLIVLTIMDLGGDAVTAGVIAGVMYALAMPVARWRIAQGATAGPATVLAVAALIVALVLTVLRDIHGPAVLAGTATMAALRWGGRHDSRNPGADA